MNDDLELPWLRSALLTTLVSIEKWRTNLFLVQSRVRGGGVMLHAELACWLRKRSNCRMRAAAEALKLRGQGLIHRADQLPTMTAIQSKQIRLEMSRFKTDIAAFKGSYAAFKQEVWHFRLDAQADRLQTWVHRKAEKSTRRQQSLIEIVKRAHSEVFFWEIAAWIFWPSSERDHAIGDLVQRYQRKKLCKSAADAEIYFKREVADAIWKRLSRVLLVAKLIEFIIRHTRD